jgi:RimJ/RimL family protein N-acetyltransferase
LQATPIDHSPVRMPLDRLFSSDRLIYRYLENTPESREHYLSVLLKDPETYGQSSYRLLSPLTLDDINKTFSGAAATLLSVVIHLKHEDGREPTAQDPPVGWLALESPAISRQHRSCSLSITISPDYQGKGYGSESITWALNWAFGVAGMHSV